MWHQEQYFVKSMSNAIVTDWALTDWQSLSQVSKQVMHVTHIEQARARGSRESNFCN